MRRSIYLYLFVFTALIVVFQYVTSRRMISSKEEEVEELKAELDQLKQQQLPVQAQSNSSEAFLLQSNDNALYYFEEMGYEIEEVVQQIEDAVIGENKASEDNQLVPYAGMEGPMRINQIRILNQKWLLADFTDGSHWGELFITYYFDEEGKLVLETENSLLYPKD